MADDQNTKRGPRVLSRTELEKSADEAVEFLKDSQAKATLKDFLIDTYKRFESERVEKVKSRVEHEHEVNSNTTRDFHTPGNIAPLLDEALNMSETENAMVRGLSATKRNLQRTVENRVEEINRLLAGIGGFSAQLKSCFARSTVVFMEQDDPKHVHRERLIFSINLPNYELKRPMAKIDRTGEPKKPSADPQDGQATWDDAVNALARIVETTGLKPKFVKNDRKYGRFTMTQELRSNGNLPDEYFSLTLDYNTEERIQELCKSYNKILGDYDHKIAKLSRSVGRYPGEAVSGRHLNLKTKLANLMQERDYFVGSVPDPNQIDEGILFLIEVVTNKDYHIVKDRMQSLMTKFILHLSHIAAKQAESDPELEYDLWKSAQLSRKHKAKHHEEPVEADDLEGVPEYTIDTTQLKLVKNKKTG